MVISMVKSEYDILTFGRAKSSSMPLNMMSNIIKWPIVSPEDRVHHRVIG